AREPEGNIAKSTGDVDLRAVFLTKTPDGLQTVVAELALHRDGEDQRIDVDILNGDAFGQRSIYHPRSIGNSLLVILRHALFPSCGDNHWTIVLACHVERSQPLKRSRVQERSACLWVTSLHSLLDNFDV